MNKSTKEKSKNISTQSIVNIEQLLKTILHQLCIIKHLLNMSVPGKVVMLHGIVVSSQQKYIAKPGLFIV